MVQNFMIFRFSDLKDPGEFIIYQKLNFSPLCKQKSHQNYTNLQKLTPKTKFLIHSKCKLQIFVRSNQFSTEFPTLFIDFTIFILLFQEIYTEFSDCLFRFYYFVWIFGREYFDLLGKIVVKGKV